MDSKFDFFQETAGIEILPLTFDISESIFMNVCRF